MSAGDITIERSEYGHWRWAVELPDPDPKHIPISIMGTARSRDRAITKAQRAWDRRLRSVASREVLRLPRTTRRGL